MRKSKFLTALLALVMLLSLFSITALAADDDGVTLTKTAKLEDNGTYSIEMSAYTTGSVTTSSNPLDIVLVLDVSSSMVQYKLGSVTRLQALKNSVNYFINTTKTKNDAIIEADSTAAGDSSKLNSISIVKFSSESNSGIVSDLTVVDSSQVSTSSSTSLVSKVNALTYGTNTRTDLGMNYAISAVEDFQNDGKDKIVILFTDGCPSTEGSTTYMDAYAGPAVHYANTLKNTYGATIFSIGLLSDNSGTSVVDTSLIDISNYTDWDDKANCFLNMVSSNYPDADYTNSTYYPYKDTGKTGTDRIYYMGVGSSEESLEKIFSDISKAISKSTLDATAILQDTITAPFDVNGAGVDVYTQDYLGNGNFDELKDFSASYIWDGNTLNVSGFDYSDNYVIDADSAKGIELHGKKLVVKITGILPTDGAVTGESLLTNVTDSSGLFSYDGSLLVYKKVFSEQPSTILKKKYYVLDFGKSVQLTPSHWSMQKSGETICGAFCNVSTSKVDAKDTYGQLNASSLIFTPEHMDWGGYDNYYILGKYTSDATDVDACSANKATGNLWAKVTVMPATSVYYEDTFVTTAATDTRKATVGIVYSGKWTHTTDATDTAEECGNDYDAENSTAELQSSNNTGYGTDSSYNNDWKDSNGSAHKAISDYTLEDDDEVASGNMSTASFTFTGTGVDIYSRTDMTQGLIAVTIKNDDKTYDKTYYVDNSYEGGDGTLYNIPTASFTGLDSGTYYVTIEVLNGALTNPVRNTYYLDGIRVYNPVDANDDTVYNAYDEAGENSAYVKELRDILLDANSFKADDYISDAAVFIAKDNDSTGTISTYQNYGPKHEVYLNPGDTVAFEVKCTWNSKNSAIYIGMKVPTAGSSQNVTINGTAQNVEVKSATDMYYKGNVVERDGHKYVVISNPLTNTGKVALTKVKVTNSASGRTPTLVATKALADYAWDMADLSNSYEASTNGKVSILNAEEETVTTTSNAAANDLYNSVKASADAFLN